MTYPRSQIWSDESTVKPALGLLPRDLRNDLLLLYGVFRTLDDLVDEHDPAAETAISAVENWCQNGAASSRETKTLAALTKRWPLPREALHDFCQGMRHDLTCSTIETEEDLDHYCYQVGGTVGITVTVPLGVTNKEEAVPKAAALGMAMQRTNILRDIDEDLANSRIYIARKTIEKFGSIAPGQREELVRDQIARAERLLEEGISAIPLLTKGRRAISVMAALYKETLRQIEREEYGRKAGRAVPPRWRRELIKARSRLSRFA